jgi:predicted phosphoribosyltransferase
MVFKDRFQAGKLLARNLKDYKDSKNTVVIALPRGGVPVGYEIAKELNLPLNIFFVKKIPSPFNQEVAIGAVSENEFLYKNHNAINILGIDSDYIEQKAKEILEYIKQKRKIYKIKPINLKRKRVILVDDGIATGATILLAIIALKKQECVKEVIVASPVASLDSINLIHSLADKIEVLLTPQNFTAVGAYYQRFHQLSDDEVVELLTQIMH